MKRHGLLPVLGAGTLLASGLFSSPLAAGTASGPGQRAQASPFDASDLLSGPGGFPVASLVPSLGAAQGFAVLAGSTVTNTGATVVTGALGVSPGNRVTGFPPGIVVGAIHAADPLALQAQGDLTLAYDGLAGLPCNTTLTGQDLGGLTLASGVYCFATSAENSGILTLDAQGDPDAVFVFQIGTTLTTAIGSSVLMIGGGQSSNVYWQVGSSATLDTGSAFAGNILALASVTLNTGATVSGRALARTGAVTMDANVVTRTLPAGPGSFRGRVCLQRDLVQLDPDARGEVSLSIRGDQHSFEVKVRELAASPGQTFSVLLEEAVDSGTFLTLGEMPAPQGNSSASTLTMTNTGAPPAQLGGASLASLANLRVEIRDNVGARFLWAVLPGLPVSENLSVAALLEPPPASPSPSAVGSVKGRFKGAAGCSRLDVKVRSLPAGPTYSLWVEDATGSGIFAEVGDLQNGKLRRDTKKGDPLPLGVPSVGSLSGRRVQVRADGAVHLEGTIS